MIEAVLAVILVALSQTMRVRVDWNLSDEGFLWNGSLRIGQGKIPIRDYKSYDPGRFYWSWAWMHVFGTGLLGLRLSVAVFQTLGLWAGLAALGTRTDSILALTLAGVVLVTWMLPRHKLFEHAMALIAVATVTALVQSPTLFTALLAGMVTGFAGVMGRNHLVYFAAAVLLALLLVAMKGATEGPAVLVAAWAIGTIIGYAPMLAMFFFVQGFFRRYLRDKVQVFRRRGIDLALPVPWPWTQNYSGLGGIDRLSRIVIDLHYVALPLLYVTALVWILISPNGLQNPLLVAACLVGLSYLHHVSKRPDLPHLCQAIQPFLCALFALIYASESAPVLWLTPLALLAIAWLVARRIDPWLECIEFPQRFAEVEMLGERFRVNRGIAASVDGIRALVKKHLAAAEGLFIAPSSAMLYPILQIETPVRSDFMLFPETQSAQNEIIGDLEKNRVNWALTRDHAQDQRDELRFRNTHAKVWAYLDDNFERMHTDGLDAEWDFWRRKSFRVNDR